MRILLLAIVSVACANACGQKGALVLAERPAGVTATAETGAEPAPCAEPERDASDGLPPCR